MRNSITGQTTTPVRNLVDFALGPRHNQALIVRRASGNLHTLSPADRPAVALATAADFRGLCFNPTGDRYAVWARSTPADPWRLLVGPAGQSPTVYSFDQRDTGPGLPGPLHWQGDALAFSYQDEVQSRSFIIGLADGHVLPLPTGRFGAWLNQPGQYLLLDAGRLAVAHTDPATPAVVLATLPDLVWARALTDPEGYLAMTQDGNMLRLWQGALQPGEPPRLVTELPGKLVQAQLSRRGTLLMVQQLADTPQRRGECRVTLVELPTATQEPLSGVCVRAQLLPVQ